MEGIVLYGWDSVNSQYRRILVSDEGKLIIDKDVEGTLSPDSLEVSNNIAMPYCDSADKGVVTKGGNRFIHDYNPPDNGTANPAGDNLFIGERAGNFSMGATASYSYHSSFNFGMGYLTLSSLTTGFKNVAIGYRAMDACTRGFENTAIGIDTIKSLTRGYNNVGLGANALRDLDNGDKNLAMGSNSMQKITGVDHNVAFGFNSGKYTNAGGDNTSPTGCIYIGSETTSNASDETNEVVIGYDAEGQGDNTVTLGNDSIVDTYLKGRVHAGNGRVPSEQWSTGSAVTENDLYDRFSSYVPDIGDYILLNGAGWHTGTSKLFVVTSVYRDDTNIIGIYGMFDDGGLGTMYCTNGDSTNVFDSLSFAW